ncbi:hypothetical protein ES332_D08G117400v1 [Gossypium tomentosum]|uniref:AB hydrolase-1 domain-containing protein n=1 Tax=Gossypium tomentosum TaxID=34277 RepID=A0A5D2JTW1_GOSTO|nr:hypothetical protein ES332_D08G117400v1 [Gossypium tomentosum]
MLIKIGFHFHGDGLLCNLHFSLATVAPTCKNYRPFLSQTTYSFKSISIRASSTSLDYSTPSSVNEQKALKPTKTNYWEWKFKDNVIDHWSSEEYTYDANNIRCSTVEEWRGVAKDILERSGKLNLRATIVDWPGLGFSSRPKMDYDADVMENFVVDFINEISSSVGGSFGIIFPVSMCGTLGLNMGTSTKRKSLSSIENDLLVFGGGHAATIVVRAAKKGLVKPKAIAAVAPTWAGPLPIVFGRDSSMQTRYGLLRGILRTPGAGWMMYNMLVSNEGAIQSQYKSHVYANPQNVTPAFVQSRYKLTTEKGSRYVPAAFLTGLLDPVNSRDEFLELFSGLEGKTPILVVSTEGSPKRSKAEMEALREARGVSKFVKYPSMVAEELYKFLQENFEVNA